LTGTASNKNISLSPSCLFDIKKFLENYDIDTKIRDERIKMGIEEIIAIKKGQKITYPQIRIFVKDGHVQAMKFYSITGKNYYSMKVNNYSKIGNIDMPDDIVEEIKTNKNTISTHIKYTNVQLNQDIDDSEF
jgi:hypothetical protein